MKNDDLKKRKRKRKSRDPDWTKARESLQYPRKKRKTNMRHLMGIAAPSPQKSTIVDSSISTPLKGSSMSKVVTPQGTILENKRSIRSKGGEAAFFVSKDQKEGISRLSLPEPNDWVKNQSIIPEVSLEGVTDKEITRASIMKARRAKKKRGSKRGKSQRQVMGNISAKKALENAGIFVKKGEAHWTHFVGHQFIDDKSQVPNNLGLALKWANGAMTQVEEEICYLLIDADKNIRPKALYLTVVPKWAEGFKSIRLLESITVEVSDALYEKRKNFVSLTFDALLRDRIPKKETEFIQSEMRKIFLKKKPEISDIKSEAARVLLFSPHLRRQNVKNKIQSSKIKPK